MKGNLLMTAADNLAFEQSIGMLERSVSELKRVAKNLIPAALFQKGLDATLRESCIQINQLGQFEITYESEGLEEANLDESNRTRIYLLIQSLINHACTERTATQVSVRLEHLTDLIIINLTDNGKQMNLIDMDTASRENWSEIQKMVALLNGKIDIHSVTDNRFSIEIVIRLLSAGAKSSK